MVKDTGSGRLLSSYLTELSEADRQFLAGKRDRGADLESAIRIFLEFLQGFEFLALHENLKKWAF